MSLRNSLRRTATIAGTKPRAAKGAREARAYALKVASSFLLALLGRPSGLMDLPNFSSGRAATTSVEFDAWLTGTSAGAYRSTNAADIAERNEIAAFRELHGLFREQTRLRALRNVEQDWPGREPGLKPSDRTDDRITSIKWKISEI